MNAAVVSCKDMESNIGQGRQGHRGLRGERQKFDSSGKCKESKFVWAKYMNTSKQCPTSAESYFGSYGK